LLRAREHDDAMLRHLPCARPLHLNALDAGSKIQSPAIWRYKMLYR
jgi:hypothetical protein